MNSKLAKKALPLLMALGLGACATNAVTEQPGDLTFGEANRQTMLAQVVDPDVVYTEPARSNGAHAADAVERYRTDKVKQPDSYSTKGASTSQPGPNR